MKDACCSSGACSVDISKVQAVKFRLSPEQRKELVLLIVAFVLGLAGIILWEFSSAIAIICLAAAYILAGYEVLRGAVRNIMQFKPFDELFLMSVASLGAFAIGAMEEAVGVMVLYRVGEFLQDVAVTKSRQSIKALLSLKAETARVLRNGQWEQIESASVQIGDLVQIRPGERVPVDGEVVEGTASLDTASMTGESLPRPAQAGTEVLSGFIVMDGVLVIRTLRLAKDSAASRIIWLVEEATKNKAKPERFIHRFALWYTPAVVFLALAVALVPPLLVPGQRFSLWIYRALTMLVISCPCAFVLSIPLSYFAGLGGAARKGILVKGAAVLDTLAKARSVVFDKTGTLTDAAFTVKHIQPADGFTAEELLSHAVLAGSASNHPLSVAVQRFYASQFGKTHQSVQPDESASFTEIPGHGSVATVNGREILAGNDRLLHLKQIPHRCEDIEESVIHVAVAGTYAGKIMLGDRVKADAQEALRDLKRLGVQDIAVLTGDNERPAMRTARELGGIPIHHGLLPQDKLAKVESMLNDINGRGSLVYVGDGINDAPVLARSDAGIAMGGIGTDAAIENADVVLMTDEVRRIPQLIIHAKKTQRIVTQNIVFALGFKLAFLALGALGFASMWEAVIADVGVALLAVVNASRALR